ESSLAHYILHLLQEGKVTLEDDKSKLDLNQADHEKVKRMIKENHLGFSQIKIFSLKYSDMQFVFIFAESGEIAKKFFRQQFKKEPFTCTEMLMNEPITKGNRTLTFRELRKEFNSFPAFAGIYDRRNGYTV
ncbi:MAG TPA: hypothetical protein VLA13_01585, partial [Massilibacterium sp.]|nr:hypothetical protein [Massilibacterium sp.]